MQNLPLIGGSYSARSVIANAQRCLNLFPEVNRQDAPVPMTHYQRPGLVPLVAPGSPGTGRGIYQASNGDAYVVIERTLYFVSSSWVLFPLGLLTDGIDTPVSMIDNGIQLMVVDGVAAAGNAEGTVNWTVNPSINDTVTLNGVVYTFIAGATSGTNIHIAASLGLTIGQELLGALQASVDPLITVATYTTGTNATGAVNFAVNPSINDTVTFNGVVFTFIAGPTSGTNVNISGSVGLTIGQELLGALQASTNDAITAARYSSSAGGGGSVNLGVNYKVPGTIGTSYTLAASAATPTGANLTIGGFGDSTSLIIVYNVPGAIGTTYTLAASVAYVSSANLVLGVIRTGGGWYVDLGETTGASFTEISDESWTGADRVDFIDTFIIWNQPGTRNFGSTLSNQIVPLDPLYVAGKTGYPDPLQSVIVNKNEIFLPGSLKSEIWYNAGGSLFPFARLPGVYVEHGIVAKYSICSSDINVFWLSKNLQGQGIVLRKQGYEVKRISNHALEFAIQRMSDFSDAVGFCFQQDGHTFYVLSFPTGNQTWVWDESIGDPMLGWTQWGWTDRNGGFNRTRGQLGASLYGKNVVIDWENGTLYEQSPTTYTDTVDNVEGAIQFLRTFPHLMSGTNPQDGKPILAEGKMVQHERFQLNAEMGTNTSQLAGFFTIRYSDDRGKTWDGVFTLSSGDLGKFLGRPDARALGQAMDRVYEVSWSFPGQVALQGAWVEGKVLGQ